MQATLKKSPLMSSSIKVESCDGKIFEIDSETAKQLGMLKALIARCGLGDEKNEKAIIPLPKIHSAVLATILKWAEHHKGDAQPKQFAEAGDGTHTKQTYEADYTEMLARNLDEVLNLTDRSAKTNLDESSVEPTERAQSMADISAWDAQFLDDNDDSMPDLMFAANNLSADALVEAAGKRIANKLNSVPERVVRGKEIGNWEELAAERRTIN